MMSWAQIILVNHTYIAVIVFAGLMWCLIVNFDRGDWPDGFVFLLLAIVTAVLWPLTLVFVIKDYHAKLQEKLWDQAEQENIEG